METEGGTEYLERCIPEDTAQTGKAKSVLAKDKRLGYTDAGMHAGKRRSRKE